MVEEKPRYISRLRIENFQNHRDTDINFDTGINLIVGSSDAGKSAVLRAINWLFHNSPKSTSFVRHGSDETRVTAWFNDGTRVSRIKGKKRNAITIHKSDGTDLVFDKIGSELPQEAIEALGNPPINEKNGPISYSEQLDSYFLVSLSPTDLPRSISELIGIDDFEDAASVLSKQSNQFLRQAKDSQDRISDFIEQLKKYDNLDDQLNKLLELEKQSEKIESLSSDINGINNLLSKYGILISTGRKTNKQLKLSKSIFEFSKKLPKSQLVKDNIQLIEKLLCSYEQTINNEEKINKEIIRRSGLLIKDKFNNIDVAKKIATNIGNINELIVKYEALKIKGNSIKSNYVIWSNNGKTLQGDWEILAEDMKSKGLWCFNCDRPLAIDRCIENHNGR
jgi:DNA repair exonuclease SbcCD ATPase subunit